MRPCISALMSPVNAPAIAGWQCCHSMSIRPQATCTARAISVAVVQIRMSATGSVAVTDATIASISPSCVVRPFILQFPAIDGRTWSSRRGRAMGHCAVPRQQ